MLQGIFGYLRGVVGGIVREASIGEYVEDAERGISGYLRTGIRKEIVGGRTLEGQRLEGGVNWGALLRGLVGGLSEDETYDVLDGVGYYFVAGKSLDPKYDIEEEGEHKELEDLGGGEWSWEKGYGGDVSQRLIAGARELIKSHRLMRSTDPKDLQALARDVVMRGKDLDGEEELVLKKLKKDLSSILATQVLNNLRSEKKHILERRKKRAPLTVLEPEKREKGERGEGVEKVHSRWLEKIEGLGIDLEEIEGYVKQYPGVKGRAYMMIFQNIVGDPPYGDMSQTELAERLHEETGKAVDQTTLSRWTKELMDILKERFFRGVSRKEKVDIGKSDIKGLSKDELEDFVEFLGGELSGGILERVEKVVRGLHGGKMLKEIAEEEGIKIDSVKKDVERHIKPKFEEWKKEGRMGSIDVRGIIHSVLAARRGPTQRDILDQGRREQEVKERVEKRVEEKLRGIPEGKDEPIKVEEEDRDEVDKAFGAAAERALKGKAELREKIKKQFDGAVLKPRNFIITVEFSSRYDWSDVDPRTFVHSKFHPVKDERGNWTSDDPEFKWVGYRVQVDEVKKYGNVPVEFKYDFHVGLTDEGEVKGEVKSELLVVNKKSGEEIVKDHGGGGYKGVIDDEFMGLVKGHGVLPAKSEGFPVGYENIRLKRQYHNISEFDKWMGGLAFSDPKHRERVKDYKEFLKRKEEHQMGSWKTEMKVSQLLSVLKSMMKKPHLTLDEKDKVMGYIKELKKKDISGEKKKEIEGFLEVHDHAEMERMKEHAEDIFK